VLFNQQIIGIKSGDGEDADSRVSKRRGKRSENPCQRKIQRPGDFQTPPISFTSRCFGNISLVADDGKLVRRSRDGKELSL
jgi:hypothetical protein